MTQKFKKFESKYYDFYRFSSLVKDILIVPNNISIPYDVEMKLIFKSYKSVDWNLLSTNKELTPYDLQVLHINADIDLKFNLKKYNENY